MVTEDEVFAVLGNAYRRRLLMLLLGFGELCVCELFQALDQPQATVSRHLSLARNARLVEGRREGTWIHYRLHRDLPPWVLEILSALRTGPGGQVYRDDEQRLRSTPNRPVPCCKSEKRRSSS